MDYLINAFRGFCMALADSVPGVSGGTIAFILGFYDKFIGSLDKLIYGKKEDKKEALFFLIKIGIGWVIGMVLAIVILSSLFQKHIYGVSSLFLGFIICSIPLIIKAEKDVLKGKYINLIFTAIGIAIVALITYFNPIAGTETAVNIGSLNIGLGLYIYAGEDIPEALESNETPKIAKNKDFQVEEKEIITSQKETQKNADKVEQATTNFMKAHVSDSDLPFDVEEEKTIGVLEQLQDLIASKCQALNKNPLDCYKYYCKQLKVNSVDDLDSTQLMFIADELDAIIEKRKGA